MARILVIDDDPDFVEAARLVLEKAGHTVDSASGPEEGVAKVGSGRPDLVVLDVMMPSGYEGFDVARKIREDLGLRSLPVVIVTSVHEKKKVPYRFAPDEQYLPVDVFLDKPVDPGQLLATVGELLGERRVEPKSPL
jgi:CheY-like chemotaxis protein